MMMMWGEDAQTDHRQRVHGVRMMPCSFITSQAMAHAQEESDQGTGVTE
jgi:hypothetical protein